MIKCENNMVAINGKGKELITEFMCIVQTMVKKGVMDKDDALMYTYLASVPKEEVKQMMLDAIDNMDNIGDALNLLRLVM